MLSEANLCINSFIRGHAGTDFSQPQVAEALFGDVSSRLGPQAVWGCLGTGWSDESGFWVHPIQADASIHAAAAVTQDAPRFMSRIECYRAHSQLGGRFWMASGL